MAADTTVYKSLNDNITKYIARTDELYKLLQSPEHATTTSNAHIDIGSSPDTYRKQLWSYFTDRYREQTTLKDHYFNLENALLNKQKIIKKQATTIQTELDSLRNSNQLAISNLHNDKYQLHYYANRIDIYKTIAISLLCIILAQIFNICGLISMPILLIITASIIVIDAIIISHNWYSNSHRTNNDWDLLNNEPIKKDDNQQCTPQFIKHSTSDASADADSDARIKALSI
jgi:hypothetical protein